MSFSKSHRTPERSAWGARSHVPLSLDGEATKFWSCIGHPYLDKEKRGRDVFENSYYTLLCVSSAQEELHTIQRVIRVVVGTVGTAQEAQPIALCTDS